MSGGMDTCAFIQEIHDILKREKRETNISTVEYSRDAHYTFLHAYHSWVGILMVRVRFDTYTVKKMSRLIYLIFS